MTDVRAKNMTSTGAASVGPCRVRGMSMVASGAGSVSFKNGGASGTELIKIDLHGAGTHTVDVPSNGVWLTQDPYVTLTGVTSITFFYG